MNTAVIDDHYITHWLLSNPDFFIRQGSLLADLRLTSPYSHRAISLQERQLEILREKVRGLELRIVELLRYGHENDSTLSHLHRWLLNLLSQPSDTSVAYIAQSLGHAFSLPYATLKLWSETDVPAAVQTWVDHLDAPRCGSIEKNADGNSTLGWLNHPLAETQILNWLNDSQIASIALIPLRPLHIEEDITVVSKTSVGLLILGAHDEQRFSAEMGTVYLAQIGELVSAALTSSLTVHNEN